VLTSQHIIGSKVDRLGFCAMKEILVSGVMVGVAITLALGGIEGQPSNHGGERRKGDENAVSGSPVRVVSPAPHRSAPLLLNHIASVIASIGTNMLATGTKHIAMLHTFLRGKCGWDQVTAGTHVDGGFFRRARCHC
jgi:hypothetical protein